MTPTSSVSRSFPTLRYLAAPFRWLFGSRRRVLTAAAVLLAMIAAPVVVVVHPTARPARHRRPVQHGGVPVVHDPRRPQRVRALPPGDGLAQAAEVVAQAVRRTHRSGRPWPKDVAEARRWIEENREAMALSRRGNRAARRARPGPAQRSRIVANDEGPPVVPRAGPVRGARLEERGDMAGAWGWYRAALRATYHVGLRSLGDRADECQQWHGELRYRLTQWAADPRTTPA